MSNMSPDTMLNNRYKIERMLGQGGMGAVYLALDTALDTAVALKVNQNPAPQSSTQFLREARLLASLRHPNLPRVTDYFILGSAQYLVMDYISGKDLNTILQEEGAQPVERVLDWARQLGNALSYLHNQQPPVIHRDIKPANVRLSAEGDAILVDFGIAKVFDADHQATSTGAMGYTPGYAPPEQYGGAVRTGPYSDQYSLAALIYHLLTRQKPADSVQRAVANAPLTPVSRLVRGVPPSVEAAIHKALSLRPNERFASVDDFLRALATPAAAPAEPVEPTRRAEPSSAPTMVANRPPDVATMPAPPKPHVTSRVEMAIPAEALQAAPPRKTNWLLISGIGLVIVIGLGVVGLLAGGLLFAKNNQPATTVGQVNIEVTSTISPTPEAAQNPPPQASDTVTPSTPSQTPPPAVAEAATDTPSSPTETPAPANTDTPEASAAPQTLGNGGWLAFASDRSGGILQIWKMHVAINNQGKLEATDLTQVTNNPGDKTQPAWSPDGKRLLYVSEGGPDYKKDIWMINADGSGEPHDLTNTKGDEIEPAWSPDGKWIAYTSDSRSDKVLQLYLVRADGGERYRLSYDQEEFGPAWSPNNYLSFIMNASGQRIIYIRGQLDFKTGAAPTREYYVTPYRFDTMDFIGNLGQASEPAWSPDGKWLVYTRMNNSNLGRTNIGLSRYPMRTKETDVLKLTSTDNDWNPSWSPDGQWIVFNSGRDGNDEVYIMNISGQLQTNLTNSAGRDLDPAWQPTGN